MVTADTTYYVYDGMFAVAELDGGLDLKSKYVYTNGMLVGRIDSTGELYQYFHDGLGSITMIVDSTGSYQNLYTYDDFGDFRKKDEAVSNSYCYTGQERDEAPSGLYNLRARYYAAGIGRFTQEDPVDYNWGRPQRMNLYTYVMNNPVNRLDPLGLVCYPIFPPRIREYIWEKRKVYTTDWDVERAFELYGQTGMSAIYCLWKRDYAILGLVTRVIKQLYICYEKCKDPYPDYRRSVEPGGEKLLGWGEETVEIEGFAFHGGLTPKELFKKHLYPEIE